MVKIIGYPLDVRNRQFFDKINKHDFKFIKGEINKQVKGSAEYIYISADFLKNDELPFLLKTINIVENLGAKAMICSRNFDVLKELVALKKEIIIGNLFFSPREIEPLVDSVRDKDIKIVALVTENWDDFDVFPEKSLFVAQMFVDYLLDAGIKRENILLQPMLPTLDSGGDVGKIFLNTLELFKLDFPHIPIIVQSGEISLNLPRSDILESILLSLAVEKGIDYLITDINLPRVKEALLATLAIIGKDTKLNKYYNLCKRPRRSVSDEKEEIN